MTHDRSGKITVAWTSNGIGHVSLDGEWWATVEWSVKRGQFCIEDVEGRCLQHTESIHGQAVSREEAIALAEAMIRDGRMPSPEEARARANERRHAEARERRLALEQRKAEGRDLPRVIADNERAPELPADRISVIGRVKTRGPNLGEQLARLEELLRRTQ